MLRACSAGNDHLAKSVFIENKHILFVVSDTPMNLLWISSFWIQFIVNANLHQLQILFSIGLNNWQWAFCLPSTKCSLGVSQTKLTVKAPAERSRRCIPTTTINFFASSGQSICWTLRRKMLVSLRGLCTAKNTTTVIQQSVHCQKHYCHHRTLLEMLENSGIWHCMNILVVLETQKCHWCRACH